MFRRLHVIQHIYMLNDIYIYIYSRNHLFMSSYKGKHSTASSEEILIILAELPLNVSDLC